MLRRLLAHALFAHDGFDAGFDGLRVEQVGHEADWAQAGVQHVVRPRNGCLLAQVAAPVQVARAQAVGVGQQRSVRPYGQRLCSISTLLI